MLELLVQEDDARFALTPLGRCLTADAPDSVRSWALLASDGLRTTRVVPTPAMSILEAQRDG